MSVWLRVCSGLVSVTAPVPAAGTQAPCLWESNTNYWPARALCYLAAVASLGIYSARPQAVPLPDQDFVLPAETPASAPRYRGLCSRRPHCRGRGRCGSSLRERQSPAGGYSIFHQILSHHRSSCPLKWDGRWIFVSLPAHGSLSRTGEELGWAAPGPRGAGGTGRAGGTGSASLLAHPPGCRGHPAPPPAGADCAPRKLPRGDFRGDFQMERVWLRGGAVRGRRLGARLRAGVPPSAGAICLWNSMKTRGKKLSAFLPRIFVSVVQGENKCV